MVGVFDSGRGGEYAAAILRGLLPKETVVLFADRANAPFGTKCEEELERILEVGLDRLTDCGCSRVLLACCTMCTVLPRLSEKYRRIACPIIEPTAKAALAATENGRIAVLATERTVTSHAFRDTLERMNKNVLVFESAAQGLVSVAECGGPDSDEDFEYLKSVLRPVKECGADTLILGCTHFPTLKKEIGEHLPNVVLIDSAHEGAKAMLRPVR